MTNFKIPIEVTHIIKKLNDAGHEAYIVGGCVRDVVIGRAPTDWDVTTNATPEEVQKLFPDSFYENEFGTVGVKTESEDETLAVIEVTTYRAESGYSDKRRPDEVRFVKTLREDLERRDFTMNAIALAIVPSKAEGQSSSDVQSKAEVQFKIEDPFGGQADIEKKIIRAVGDPEQRFSEDALRMMRAVRFASTLGFAIDEATREEIEAHNAQLAHISQERIRDELTKLVMGDHAHDALELLKHTHLLEYILPELLEGVDVTQNLHHIYTVWEHNALSFKYAIEQNYSLEVRLASLLHDVAKPRTKRGEGYNSTFYGHDVVGARMAREALMRLKLPKDMVEKVAKLVRYHMFYYNPEEVTESSVRRLVANIGRENVEDLLKVREADRIGSGVPKAIPYKLRHLKFMIDKVARDPISPKMLKLNGTELMEFLNLEPGPKVGMIIHALMEEVLDDPSKNERDYLITKARELSDLTVEELEALKARGKEKMAELEAEEIIKIKQKHYVR